MERNDGGWMIELERTDYGTESSDSYVWPTCPG